MADSASVMPSAPSGISHSYVVFLSVGSLTTLLSTAFVILRFISRRLSISFGWDDWIIMGALLFSYALFATTVIGATTGHAGYHITVYSESQLETYLKIVLANDFIYNISISLSKLGILLMYRRIFAVRSFRIWIWIVAFFVVGYLVTAEFGLIFAYNPVEAQWKFWLPHTAINSKAFWISMSCINTTLDVVILCMPQTRVWKLHQTMKKKVLLSIVFLLGGFVCIVSIVRIWVLFTIDFKDLTYTLSAPGIWTKVEADVSIICACLPTLPTLFRYWYDGKGSVDSVAGTGGSVSVRLRNWLHSTWNSKNRDYADIEAGRKYSATSSQRLPGTVNVIRGGELANDRRPSIPMGRLDSASGVHVRTDVSILSSK